jgi:hypothetical protein
MATVMYPQWIIAKACMFVSGIMPSENKSSHPAESERGNNRKLEP